MNKDDVCFFICSTKKKKKIIIKQRTIDGNFNSLNKSSKHTQNHTKTQNVFDEEIILEATEIALNYDQNNNHINTTRFLDQILNILLLEARQQVVFFFSLLFFYFVEAENLDLKRK